MTKEELIHQVLSETNIDLYNFWATKLLTEYPEYKQKILNYWVNLNYEVYKYKDINNVIIDDSKRLHNGCNNEYSFYYTSSIYKESSGYLNWILREEQNKQIK